MKKNKSKFENLNIEEILIPKELKSIKGGACFFSCRSGCKERCLSGGANGTKTELLEQS